MYFWLICKTKQNEEYYTNISMETAEILLRVTAKHRKVKVKLSLCLTKPHAMKVYWRNGGIAPRIL
jgi:hypothetical protein